MTDKLNPGSGRVRIEFKIPTRGLFGIRTEFLSETRGTGLLYHTFLEYGPYRGEIASRTRGALVAKEAGDTTAYAIEPLQERSTLFVVPGQKVYGGQVVGENSRDVDMVVQVCRKKHLTNMRASTSDIAVQLAPARMVTTRRNSSPVECESFSRSYGEPRCHHQQRCESTRVDSRNDAGNDGRLLATDADSRRKRSEYACESHREQRCLNPESERAKRG